MTVDDGNIFTDPRYSYMPYNIYNMDKEMDDWHSDASNPKWRNQVRDYDLPKQNFAEDKICDSIPKQNQSMLERQENNERDIRIVVKQLNHLQDQIKNLHHVIGLVYKE